ncbi:YihY/virulence factor BrkB family protein [Dietzia sp. UBA5065]|uniref:YihY/virulence factor BrkB family protein n=1 Tax=Dietzia sp. UBA5065 TaxID=1946422 RepID=UPI0025C1C208|nr:YihY/virulence factor BrkB family protein [Dietzia sp. UBA5065]HMT51447.1 YihY/virulence factor BrkB family protein [Dietzia sp.]
MTAVRRRLYTVRLVLVRSVGEFLRERGPDLAGSLTFYGVLSLFPALLAAISMLGILGQGTRTVDAVMETFADVVPAEALDTIRGPVTALVTTPAAGTALVVGTVAALWTASRYVRALGRTMNAVYGVEEGRPLWRLWPAGFLLTSALVALTVIGCLALVFTGPVAERVGGWIGLGATALAVWETAKWPAAIVSAVLALAILYRFAPNVATRKFSWLSLGAGVALAVIGVATYGLNLFVTHFGNFNEVYGSLAGAIIFLLWLWSVNIAVVYGVRLDAEVLRVRQIRDGLPAEETLVLTPRDTAASVRRDRKREEMLDRYRALRLEPPVEDTPETGRSRR